MTSTITVNGFGSASGTPDAMRLMVGVGTTQFTVSRALAGVATTATRLGEVAREFTTDDRITSLGLSVWPHHTESEGDGFRASHTFEIYCDSLDRAGDLVTALAEALPHELTIDTVDPVIADVSGLARNAREAAFDDAREKATELAALAGRPLGEVVSVVEQGGGERPLRYAAEAAKVGGMPFEPGRSSVTAQLRVTWQLD
jgi:uncharacterized protein YggE